MPRVRYRPCSSAGSASGAGVEFHARLEVEDGLESAADVFRTPEADPRAVGDAADDAQGLAALLHQAGVGDTIDRHARLGHRWRCKTGSENSGEEFCFH
jgi:hypothetical protein